MMKIRGLEIRDNLIESEREVELPSKMLLHTKDEKIMAWKLDTWNPNASPVMSHEHMWYSL